MSTELRFLAYREQVIRLWPESEHKQATLAAIAVRRRNIPIKE